MPSTYAHYRLGFRTLSHLDPPIQELIRRNRKLFDLWLHGPDIFFFYNQLFHGIYTIHKLR